jgi:hypothetical protein
MTKLSLLVRLGISTAVGIGAAVAAALVITVMNLYFTGHGYGSLAREVITWDPAGVHMSIADVGIFAAMGGAAVMTWRLTGQR